MVGDAGDPSIWEEFRRQMPVVKKWAYFDHAAVAPISQPAQEAIRNWTIEAGDEGDTIWTQWTTRIEKMRSNVASVIGAHPDEIALVPNTTSGISLVAEGFPWKSGDNLVTLASEFPSNQYPWMNLANRGVETRRVKFEGDQVEIGRIFDACDERTRLLALSWVGYSTGWRVDVDQVVEQAHRRGMFVLLDAIQGLGVFPIDVRQTPVDFLAADGHKWLLGPEGAGIFYLRQEHLDLLRPMGLGWNSVVHSHDFSKVELDIRPQAARYEGGSQNMVGFAGLAASLELLIRFGLTSTSSPVADRILHITEVASERLQQAGAQLVGPQDRKHRSGIVAFEFPGKSAKLLRGRCLARSVAISLRAGRLRISPHAYNNEEDIDKLLAALQSA